MINLNHMYVVLGPQLGKVFQSPFFLEAFAYTEVKDVNTVEHGAWRGIYFRGINTYLELFESLQDKPVGSVGLGFGLDLPEQLSLVEAKMKATFGELKIGEFTIQKDQSPLFQYIEFPTQINSNTQVPLSSFIIQYTPQTFKNESFLSRTPNDPFSEFDVSRRHYNHSLVDP